LLIIQATKVFKQTKKIRRITMAKTIKALCAVASVSAMWHCCAVAGMGCSNSLGEEVM
jgi:hypothetical protein